MGATPKSKPKKSETLEVRLPYETKRDFLERCRENGTNASEVVRASIERYLKRHQRPDSETETGSTAMIIPILLRRKRFLAAGAVLAGLAGFAALPSAAGPDLRAAFDRLDANGDGIVTAEEFFGDKIESKSTLKKVVVETVEHTGEAPDEQPSGGASVEVEEDAYAVLLPPDSADGKWGMRMEVSRRKTGGDSEEARTPPDPRAEEFADMDTDRNATVSYEEFQRRFHQLMSRGFELLDADADGYLSDREFARSGGDIGPLRPAAEGGGPDMELSAEAVRIGLSRLDADKDGRISLTEYLQKA